MFAATAARTITWWDGSHYPLLACTLSISNPPGSLLLTLLGWLASRVRIVSPVAFQLNLLAALFGAATVGIATRVAIRALTPADSAPGFPERLGGLVAGLAVAFSFHFWTYSTQFTPYILTALFTSLILAAFLAWWERAGSGDALGRLTVLFLLFGLDVSVHRTNVLLLPAALLGVAIRRPTMLARPRAIIAMVAAFAVGLAFQLAYIPLSLRQPFLDVAEPNSPSRVWAYVRLEASGGNFLLNLWPRRADLFRVQIVDWLQFLARDLGGSGPPLWRWVSLALGVAGAATLVRRSPRLGWALVAFFACAGFGAVAYFNRPAAYFRPLDRHYLPSLVAFVPLLAAGASATLRLVRRVPAGRVFAGLLAVWLIGLPIATALVNHDACDRSRTRYAESYARDMFATLEPNAILFTNGDNDTFPLWYLQQVERLRPDVLVVNLPLTNTGSCVRRLRRADPAFATLLEHESLGDVLSVAQVAESVLVLRAAPHAAGARLVGDVFGDSVDVLVKPPGGTLLGQDRVALEMLRLNRWRRPVYAAITLDRSNLEWIWPLARLEGMAWRIVPSADAATWDVERLRRSVRERLPRSGAGDRSQLLEPEMGPMLMGYGSMAFMLLGEQLRRGDRAGALETLALIDRDVPLGRLLPDPGPMRTYLAGARKQAEQLPGTAGR